MNRAACSWIASTTCGMAVPDVADADAAGEVDERVAVDVRDRRVQRLGGKDGQVHLQRLGNRAGAALEELARAWAWDLGAKADRFRGRHARSLPNRTAATLGPWIPTISTPTRTSSSTAGSPRRPPPGVTAPEQMALATPTRTGRPSVRMVLLKGHDERGLRLLHEPHEPQGRRARREPLGRGGAALGAARAARCGSREPSSASATTSRSRTSTRGPRASQVSAWASPQSRPSPTGRSWSGASPRSSSGSPARTSCRCRRSGAATASSRRRSSSGRAGRTACTTAFATSSTAPRWSRERLGPVALGPQPSRWAFAGASADFV